MIHNPSRIPLATYRLQINASQPLSQARPLVDYLSRLGVTDAYPSPLFRARAHSSHGYDVIDHSAIGPDIGTEADFQGFAEDLKARGMGLLMDVVPNHMGIDDPHNAWWQDVLENGPSSRYAAFFDIDWNPPDETLKNKVLVPYLGDQFGRVLENQELKLNYDGERFFITYYQRRFPVAPRTWAPVLRVALELLPPEFTPEHPDRMELESIITALDNLPPQDESNPERLRERYREKEVTRRRLRTLCQSQSAVREAIQQAVTTDNGQPGEPHSFDALEELLTRQAYRLCYWRVAVDEINYRRFFDINELAAIRVESPEVFEAAHRMIFRFLANGWVTGLRIDHPDGLLDPQQYFQNLQDAYREIRQKESPTPLGEVEAAALYIAVEKILAHDEPLKSEWPICGTTGYDFLNLLNGLFVDRRGAYLLQDIYARVTGDTKTFAEVLYESKRRIMTASMSSELHVLAWLLDRISNQHRWSRDFTHSSLRHALREVIACFPVYRTYIRPDTEHVSDEDRRRIVTAIRAAKRRNSELSPSYFDFIGSVLLLDEPEGLSEEQRQQRRQFVLKFQQVTGPVTAKGLEDTSFYRYYPLASLNEVGGEPVMPGTSVEQFHHRCVERTTLWPFSMLATATHDTKRGEDMRARLNVLSEVPEEWEQAVRRWIDLNARCRGDVDAEPVPGPHEEYLIYQTLVGTWPMVWLVGEQRESYIERIAAYMQKALREAKVETSWLNPNEDYESAITHYVQSILGDEGREFLGDLDQFVRSVADAGFLNSLVQTLVKIGSPGVADFYQGCELWDFNLVDPDNRRPVDFDHRRNLLNELQHRAGENLRGLVDDLLGGWPDERLKLLLIWRALEFRRSHPNLMVHGNYLPLVAEGPGSDHVCAFARERDGQWAVIVVPRLTYPAWKGREGSFGDRFCRQMWENVTIWLPPEAPSQWSHVITSDQVATEAGGGTAEVLQARALFDLFPVALLEGRGSAKGRL